MKESPVFFVGMDLGTYKTSIVSSRGMREVVPTAVGWPKDMIARSLLRADTVFGEAIARNRMALRVVRPLARGGLKYIPSTELGYSDDEVGELRTAVSLVVRHAVSLMQPPSDATIFGAIGAPSRAARESKQFILDAAYSAMDAVMVVHEPFAVAYGMNCLENTLIVDIGAGTTDICPMYGSYTAEEDQLTLAFGGDHIDTAIIDSIHRDYPHVRVTEQKIRQIKEKYGTLRPSTERVRCDVSDADHESELDVTGPLVSACRSIVEPIVSGIQQVVSRFDRQLQRRLLENILLAGGGSQLSGLDIAIEQSLMSMGHANVSRVSDAVFAGAAGALKLAMNMPAEQWDKLRRSDHRRVA